MPPCPMSPVERPLSGVAFGGCRPIADMRRSGLGARNLTFTADRQRSAVPDPEGVLGLVG